MTAKTTNPDRKVITSVSLSREHKQRLEEIGNDPDDERSQSEVIRRAIEQYLDD